jgi:HEAT repeat protein
MSAVDKQATEFRNLSETEIERLIATLDSVSEGELGIVLLVACGEQAVPPLRSFLLCGAPKSVYVGRQRAVRALGQLGAVSALIEYLTTEKHISDPMLRYSEEAVENSAARELGRWKTEVVFHILLEIVSLRPLRGAVEAIGTFERKEAVPALIWHLEDDVARPAAEDALRLLRGVAIEELINAVRSPEPSGTRELPSSLLRRRSALKVLSAGILSLSEWGQLQFLLYDRDSLLSVRAAGIALAHGDQFDMDLPIRILVCQLGNSDWGVVAEAEQILLENYHRARLAIEAAIKTNLYARDLDSRKLLARLRAIARRGEST